MKDVVATMVLSKQWKSLWMFVTILVYDDSYQNIDYERFSCFVDKCLFLHEGPFIETLHFILGQTCGAEDIRVWIRAADKCSVRELHIQFISPSSASLTILPRSLYTRWKLLVTLKLVDAVLVDDVSCLISFPSLKILNLGFLKYPGGDEFVNKLLSSCPVLEELVVVQCPDDNMFLLWRRWKCYGFCAIENEMPNIDAYHVGSIFHHLVELTLCRCDEQWLNLLLRLLGDSPKLRSLNLIQDIGFEKEMEETVCVLRGEWECSVVMTFCDSGETAPLSNGKMPLFLVSNDVELALLKRRIIQFLRMRLYVTVKEVSEAVGCGVEEEPLCDDVLLAYAEGLEAQDKVQDKGERVDGVVNGQEG
ncbi:PREDICTED: putative FBD-associated F-box protein At5g56390 [Camelina sativa]|uniref:FBD-associated F-box protein At5g56390 n=1 Tax=Camelina sativa TaxID=90675 RepID=A0ABM0UTL5_CAMSA|nr:PREDICTED: putative FBD-associated F-box protein At5g56390 [Camelina sativa]